MTNEELITQATCAVLIGGRVRGTAWLCTTEGHLLTAGHILGEDDPLQAVDVQFLNDGLQKAARISWGYQKLMGFDFAVLKLANPPSGRSPLPMRFDQEAEGSFMLRGFGETLSDLSTGKGEFVGTVEVQNSTEYRLFRMRSQELAEGGYSGGAVFSERAGAVVAIQIEARAEEKLAARDTVLGMPLYRVPKVWAGESGLRPSGEEADAQKAYSHDVLLSYSRTPAMETWVKDFFVPQLETWLYEELGGTKPQIFWNHDEFRDVWTRQMVDVVRGSRHLIAVLTPSYFSCPKCLAELESFHAREASERAAVLTRIEWHKGKFPQDAQHKAIDFRDFAYTASWFPDSEVFMRFQDQVKKLASSIGGLIREAPDYKPTWPVVAPAEVRTIVSAQPHIPKPSL